MAKYGLVFLVISFLAVDGFKINISDENNIQLDRNISENKNVYETLPNPNITQENGLNQQILLNEEYLFKTSKNSSIKRIPKDPKKPKIKIRYVPFGFRSSSKEGEEECIASSSEDFPHDLFTMDQKRHGFVVLHAILAIYCFTLLAVVCNDYFLPAVELICDKLNLSQDVAAATFMAIATSAPEFFVNIVGTFVTESDIGIGTIVGSSMFNTLGVAALGGIACKSYIQIDWWPITRDSVIYILTIIMLVIMAQDEKIYWFEALILLLFYIVYFIIMWQNKRIYNIVMKVHSAFKRNSITFPADENANAFTTVDGELNKNSISIDVPERVARVKQLKTQESFLDDEPLKFWTSPTGGFWIKAWWLFSWPIRLLLKLTIPDCRKHHCLFPFTFLMCIVWIGTNSYLVSWMITVIGATLNIPDFVMGVTFLAAGGCLPEAISIVMVTRRGQGGMGVSNSLGANTLDILLCMGLPWFIKALISWNAGGNDYIQMNSDSLFYTIIALILAVVILYSVVAISGYRLSRKVGIILIVMYALFLSIAIALELFMYYDGKLVQCEI